MQAFKNGFKAQIFKTNRLIVSKQPKHEFVLDIRQLLVSIIKLF